MGILEMNFSFDGKHFEGHCNFEYGNLFRKRKERKNKDNYHIFMGYTETLFDEKRTI